MQQQISTRYQPSTCELWQAAEGSLGNFTVALTLKHTGFVACMPCQNTEWTHRHTEAVGFGAERRALYGPEAVHWASGSKELGLGLTCAHARQIQLFRRAPERVCQAPPLSLWRMGCDLRHSDHTGVRTGRSCSWLFYPAEDALPQSLEKAIMLLSKLQKLQSLLATANVAGSVCCKLLEVLIDSQLINLCITSHL